MKDLIKQITITGIGAAILFNLASCGHKKQVEYITEKKIAEIEKDNSNIMIYEMVIVKCNAKNKDKICNLTYNGTLLDVELLLELPKSKDCQNFAIINDKELLVMKGCNALFKVNSLIK